MGKCLEVDGLAEGSRNISLTQSLGTRLKRRDFSHIRIMTKEIITQNYTHLVSH